MSAVPTESGTLHADLLGFITLQRKIIAKLCGRTSTAGTRMAWEHACLTDSERHTSLNTVGIPTLAPTSPATICPNFLLRHVSQSKPDTTE